MAGQIRRRRVALGNSHILPLRRLVTVVMVWLCALPPLLEAQNKELSYAIFEESPVPTRVGNIAKDSNVSQLLGSQVFSTLRYRVLSQPDTHSELFTVNETAGILTTAALIDRESLCHFADNCRLLVYVAIQQSGGAYFVTVKVNVNLHDINDNDPKFPQASVAVSVTENLPRESIDIVPANDLDIGINTIQRYELVAEDPTMFSLVVTPNLDGSLVPNLVVNQELDRERRDFYKVVILAKDGGTPTRTGVLTLNITVDDVNDNPPVFTASEYNVSVNETLPRNTVLAKVKATDQDIGFNGAVRYRFSSRQTDDNANAFTINETTGEIRSVQDLTHLQGKALRLVVEALDRGSKPLKAQAVVNVKVVDAVNNRPAIRLTTISGGNVSLVEESAPPGYVVAHFIVADSDTGANGVVSCSVTNTNFGLQKLIDKEYKITLVGTLNREQKSRFDVKVRCWDFGKPSPLTTSVSFSVIVLDVNDNSPVFAIKLYRKNVTEEQGRSNLLRVHATDADEGENGRVTYHLHSASSDVTSLIQVDEATGVIKSRRSIDREVYKVLDFIVVAEDHGSPANTASTRVILDIADINDCKPSLPVGFTLTVAENQPRNTVVGKVEAVDEDEGQSGQVQYHLLSDNNATRFFTIEKSGVVRSKVMFDREGRDVYHLSVLANDLGTPPNTNILSVTVQVTDVNDNTPMFVRPSKTYNLVNISSVTPARSVIFLAKVKDADEGLNAQVDFSFASDNYGTFLINKSSGAVSTVRNLHPVDSGTYRLVLLARDRGLHGARSAIATLSVVVVAENVTLLDSGHVDEDHIIIVVVLVCLTILTAACVIAILLRLRHTDRRDRRHHHHGLPPESKVSYHLREVKGSGSNLSAYSGGHGVEETGRPELCRESEDDLILFKMQLAEQYQEKDLYSSKEGRSVSQFNARTQSTPIP
ncbi:protocadherin-9-like [Babylonia areolata]|uniref:protocadherin-9-like n=1 Tax=Babylonia areolata TaxID=304850 RepID=UPI003FD251C8